MLAALLTLLVGCGDDGGDDGAGDANPDPAVTGSVSGSASESVPVPGRVPDVAGDYDTVVTLEDSSCPDITVEDNLTTVEQDSTELTLTHAGLDYRGTLAPDGALFTTEPVSVDVGDDTHTLTITGTFTDAGFQAEVVAVVTGAGGACEYHVGWVGTKR